MRLINTETGEFEEFPNLSKAPPYAILSHTWEGEEQTYQEVRKIQERCRRPSRVSAPATSTAPPINEPLQSPSGELWPTIHQDRGVPFPDSSSPPHHDPTLPSCDPPQPSQTSDRDVQDVPPTCVAPVGRRVLSIWDEDSGLSKKIRKACEVARRDGYRYLWADSSCIDKTSSAELSEAINSMYDWYRGAQVCYAFLADVPSDDKPEDPRSKFRRSRWFRRGWTLQELVAPRWVFFVSQDWVLLQTKGALAGLIGEITHIDRDILTHEKSVDEVSVAERMLWAAERETTRIEDRAYSLLGIFGITMYTLYGEGDQAFRRLQEEILRRIPDQSIFLGGHLTLESPASLILRQARRLRTERSQDSLLASSPSGFADIRKTMASPIVPASSATIQSLQLPAMEYTFTPHGIRTQVRLLPLAPYPQIRIRTEDNGEWYLLILGCTYDGHGGRVLGRLCNVVPSDTSGLDFLYPAWLRLPNQDPDGVDVFALSLSELQGRHAELRTRTVYLPHLARTTTSCWTRDRYRPVTLTLLHWAKAAMEARGYTVRGPTVQQDHPGSLSVALSNQSLTIHIEVRHMTFEDEHGYPPWLAVKARIWVLPPHDSNVQEGGDVPRQDVAPYASPDVWSVRREESSNLTPRQVALVTATGDTVTLRLWFDCVANDRYGLRVEISENASGPVPSDNSEPSDEGFRSSHTSINFILLGSVQRALLAQGYIASDLELGGLDANGRDTHSLSIAHADFTIYVRYFHELEDVCSMQTLAVMAWVSLEASGGLEGYQDGPYAVAWRDVRVLLSGWSWRLEEEEVALTTPSGDPLTLCLGLDMAWQSEYDLRIAISPERRPSHPKPTESPLDGYHKSLVHLTLPGHVKRALQAQGYEVDFQGPNQHAKHRCLTLSSAHFFITITYSHQLGNFNGEDWGLPQPLTLRACIELQHLVSSAISSGADLRHNSYFLEWKDWSEPWWSWHLKKQEVKFTPTTGEELVVVLGFDLMWYSEYSLVVEVMHNRPTQSPHSQPDSALEMRLEGMSETNPGSEGVAAGGDRAQEMVAGAPDSVELASLGTVAVDVPSIRGVGDAEVYGMGESETEPAARRLEGSA